MRKHSKKKQSSKNIIKNDPPYDIHSPFIEHRLSQTLRRVLKYAFRAATILMVLVFSSISIAAISFGIHLTYCWLTNTTFKLGWLDVWMLIEAAFLLGMNIRYKVFKNLSSDHLPKANSKEFENICKEFGNISDMEGFIQGWHLGNKIEDIRSEDLFEWIAGTIFNSTVEDLSPEHSAMANKLQFIMEKKLSEPLRSRGPNETKTTKILLTLDTPTIYHRPLVYYILVHIMDRICRLILLALGFHRSTNPNKPKSKDSLPFYIRSGPSNDPPIVFFHGLGIGLTSYLPFVAGLAVSYPERNILLFEMPSITMRLDDNHVLPEEYALHVAESLRSLGFYKNIIAGHSLGSLCARWIDLYHPELIHARMFIDPVCFSLWHHYICHNALYREPKNFHEAIIKYIGMTEPGHATFLHRYFVWFQNTYFTTDLPQNCSIYLSEKDNIVNTPNVLDYLVENPHPTRRLVLIKAFRHGQILASPEVGRIVSEVQRLTEYK
ncbi:Alpha/Beta hydrolase protein [Globomyces pollinis-pini]|nr:Alpha/Beta hydrolase protein [Globomyces pollinis-pini]